MKKTKPIAFLLALALCLGLLASCSAPAASTAGSAATASLSTPQSDAAAGSTIVVADMMGRDVQLPQTVTRVVALSPSDCEILYALGAGSTLVGRGEYCDWPEEVAEVESVQSGMEINIEQILALQPEVVFMSSMSHGADKVQQLEDAGVAVMVSEAYSIAQVYQAIEMIGQCVDKADEAATLVEDMQQEFEALAAAVPSGDTKSIYFEVSPLEYGLWTAGDGSFMHEIATMLGLENCFADVGSWAEISQEQVIERNPDIIVTIAMYYGEGPTPEEEILGREGWGAIAAVQNGQVYTLNQDELSRPGPRLVKGAASLYQLVYGAGAAAA